MVYEAHHIERALDRNGTDRDAIVFELRALEAINESPCLDQTKRPWTTIARQGRQIFRKKQFRLYGGCRVEIERGNARDRLGMDHCIRRQ
jgi:hypothetical protein